MIGVFFAIACVVLGLVLLWTIEKRATQKNDERIRASIPPFSVPPPPAGHTQPAESETAPFASTPISTPAPSMPTQTNAEASQYSPAHGDTHLILQSKPPHSAPKESYNATLTIPPLAASATPTDWRSAASTVDSLLQHTTKLNAAVNHISRDMAAIQRELHSIRQIATAAIHADGNAATMPTGELAATRQPNAQVTPTIPHQLTPATPSQAMQTPPAQFTPQATAPPQAVPTRAAPAYIPPTSAKAAPPAPKQDSFLERLWQSLCDLGFARFLGARNIWVLAGISVLLLGLVFLVRFAIELQLFGPGARLIVSAIVGLVLLGLGTRQRNKSPELGLILQGGGVGALYLTVVAAVKIAPPMLPPTMAFILLVGIVAFSTFLAIAQNSTIMAHVAYVAGFLAPILVSQDSNNYIALFSYYVVLNLGIIGTSFYRQWRSLHLTGFICTALIGGIWGARRYHPDLFLSVEPFLLIFFVIFTALALKGSKPLSFVLRGQHAGFATAKSNTFVDFPLTLGTPLVFILYQSVLTKGIPFAMAFIALGMGLLYLCIAKYMWKGRTPHVANNTETAPAEHSALTEALRQGKTLQAEIYLALGVLFANLALPLALYEISFGHWRERLLSLIWAMEGAVLVWLGRKRSIRLITGAGVVALGVGAMFTLAYMTRGVPLYFFSAQKAGVAEGTPLDLISSLLMHAMGATALFCAAFAFWKYTPEYALGTASATPAPDTHAKNTSSAFLAELQQIFGAKHELFANTLLTASLVWLYVTFLFEVSSAEWKWECLLLLTVIVGTLAQRGATRLQWRTLTLVPFTSYIPLIILALPLVLTYLSLLVGGFGKYFVTWTGPLFVLAFAAYEMLRLRKQEWRKNCHFGSLRFAIALNLTLPMLVLGSLACINLAGLTLSPLYLHIVYLFWPLLFVELLMRRLSPPKVDPYMWQIMSIMLVLSLMLWICAGTFFYGNPAPLPYIPLFNPLEIGLGIALITLYLWSERQKQIATLLPNTWYAQHIPDRVWPWVLFVMLNVSIARAFSHLGGMPFSLAGAMKNAGCQAIWTLFWGGAGFAAMLRGNAVRRRSLWLMGAALVLITVGKLFLVDLTRVETLWRIVAFMMVGILLIVIGYYVPLPPARATKNTDDSDGSGGADDSGGSGKPSGSGWPSGPNGSGESATPNVSASPVPAGTSHVSDTSQAAGLSHTSDVSHATKAPSAWELGISPATPEAQPSQPSKAQQSLANPHSSTIVVPGESQ